MHVRLRQRFSDVLMTRKARAAGFDRQLESERRSMRVVTRGALARGHRRVTMVLLQSIGEIVMARDTERGRLTVIAGAFQGNPRPAGRGLHDVAAATLTGGSGSVHHAPPSHVFVAPDARRSIASRCRMSGRHDTSGTMARSLRTGDVRTSECSHQEHQSNEGVHQRLATATSRRYAVMARNADIVESDSSSPAAAYIRGSRPLMAFAWSNASDARVLSPSAWSR